jgi:hypothetical protein
MGKRFLFLFTQVVATTRKPLEQHLTGWKNFYNHPGQLKTKMDNPVHRKSLQIDLSTATSLFTQPYG